MRKLLYAALLVLLLSTSSMSSMLFGAAYIGQNMNFTASNGKSTLSSEGAASGALLNSALFTPNLIFEWLNLQPMKIVSEHSIIGSTQWGGVSLSDSTDSNNPIKLVLEISQSFNRFKTSIPTQWNPVQALALQPYAVVEFFSLSVSAKNPINGRVSEFTTKPTAFGFGCRLVPPAYGSHSLEAFGAPVMGSDSNGFLFGAEYRISSARGSIATGINYRELSSKHDTEGFKFKSCGPYIMGSIAF